MGRVLVVVTDLVLAAMVYGGGAATDAYTSALVISGSTVPVAGTSVSATRGGEPAHLAPTLKRVLQERVVHRTFSVDCTYAARHGVAVAFPEYRGLQPIIYAKSWVCHRASRLAERPQPSAASRRGTLASGALLVLVHESVHLSTFSGRTNEAETECEALRLLPRVLTRLGVNESDVDGYVLAARQTHNRLVENFPDYRGTC